MTIPAEIDRLTKLKHLILSHCPLLEALPAELGSLTSIKSKACVLPCSQDSGEMSQRLKVVENCHCDERQWNCMYPCARVADAAGGCDLRENWFSFGSK